MTRPTSSELAGQSMMLRFAGPDFTAEAREAFHRMRPCGVIFFADNITSREQVHALTAQLQAEARSLGMPPLLIAVDQEGGIVSRLPADMVTVPGAMALTAQGNLDLIERCARITGEQLREVGINVNFAPVVDVNNNPANPVIRTRSFGDTVERVVDGALATMRGLDTAHVIATVKHFPGHGDTNVDSHVGLPVIDHPLERLHAIELAPYRAAIVAGVPAVMTSHIVFPALDEHPSTLSRPILTGLLRDELGFEGLIVTDSLSMDAIDGRYGLAETAIRCKAAGVDVLESNESLERQIVRHAGLTSAIERGDLPLELFTRTSDRLERIRDAYALGTATPSLGPQPEWWGREAREAARGTIAALGDRPYRPIIPTERVLIVDFQRLRTTEAEDPFNRGGIIRESARRLLPTATVVTLGHTPDAEEIERAMDAAAVADAIVILTRDAVDLPYQVTIARQVISAVPDARIIHVALRGPYDADILGDVESTLLTFGDPAVTLDGLIEVLSGEFRPGAGIPVALH